MSEPRIEIEGLALLMTTVEAIAVCVARGWEHTIKPADERYTIAPGSPVFLLAATFEQGRIVSLEATYDPKTPARAAAPVAQLPVHRNGALLGRGWHAGWNDARTIAIVAEDDGRSVIGIHLGVIASEREVRAYLATYGQGLAPPARA